MMRGFSFGYWSRCSPPRFRSRPSRGRVSGGQAIFNGFVDDAGTLVAYAQSTVHFSCAMFWES